MTTTLPQPVDTVHDRIKLPFTFDVEKMQAEIKNLNFKEFIYYDALPLRSPAHMVDPSIPFPPPAEDFADGTWCDWLNTNSLKKSPYLTEIVEFFQKHTTVNLVRLLRLAPGGVVKEHTDPTLGLQIEKSMVRLTIPIMTNDQVEFWLNGTQTEMELGECWYLRLTDPHKVINGGASERVNLTIDMIPNDWLQSVILESDKKE